MSARPGDSSARPDAPNTSVPEPRRKPVPDEHSPSDGPPPRAGPSANVRAPAPTGRRGPWAAWALYGALAGLALLAVLIWLAVIAA